MGILIRKKIRQTPNPRLVAQELGVSLATIYRHIAGMDLKLIRELSQLPDEDRQAAIEELAQRAPDTLQRSLGVSRQYIHTLKAS